MIKNLVVNGCSYTQDGELGRFWGQVLRDEVNPEHYCNLARGGAGNFYIANSTIEYLETQNLDPTETMVVVMWSGTGRKDMRIAGSWYYHLQEQYRYGVKAEQDDNYYIFSGGLTNSWTANSVTKEMFTWLYKVSDPQTLCKDSIMHFINLENYLKVKGYQYLFTSYCNYWNHDAESSPISGDYSIGHFLKDSAVYKNFDFDNWFFVDSDQNCLGEFADSRGLMDSTRHPTHAAHEQFVQEVVVPRIRM